MSGLNKIGETFTHRNMGDNTMAIGVKFSIDSMVDQRMLHEVLSSVAHQIAERYVAENYQEIIG